MRTAGASKTDRLRLVMTPEVLKYAQSVLGQESYPSELFFHRTTGLPDGEMSEQGPEVRARLHRADELSLPKLRNVGTARVDRDGVVHGDLSWTCPRTAYKSCGCIPVAFPVTRTLEDVVQHICT